MKTEKKRKQTLQNDSFLTKIENRKQTKEQTCILPPIKMQMEKKTERNLEFHTYIASNKKQRKAKPQSSGKKGTAFALFFKYKDAI